MLVTCGAVRISSRFEDLDVGNESLVPFADNLVGIIKIIAEQMLFDRVVGFGDEGQHNNDKAKKGK